VAKLPALGQANPMTYQAKNGKQYVAIRVGGQTQRFRASVALVQTSLNIPSQTRCKLGLLKLCKL